jgi:hypothetical protein
MLKPKPPCLHHIVSRFHTLTLVAISTARATIDKKVVRGDKSER